ncbi:MAG: FtsQ-type POTRA domain-containing protein [Dehalococcoidia bacterium]|nr:FtsQ-type POTRA domain-containing protein [Dehalococcoidia bacterium]
MRKPRWPFGGPPSRTLPQARYRLGAAPAPRPQRPAFPWRRIGWAVGGSSAALALATGGAWLVRGETLRVRDVQVLGAQIVDARMVATAADAGGESLLTLDAGAVAARVEALPGVASARVRRDWPRGVVVDVTEQQGWGYWQAAGVRTVIDERGHVLHTARPPADGAPTIYELGAPAPLGAGREADADAVTVVSRLSTDGSLARLRVKAERFEFQRTRGVVVRVAAGPSAVFGDARDYEYKVAAWAAMLERVRAGTLVANEIDLRFGRELVVR